jgi:hypothetical protein
MKSKNAIPWRPRKTIWKKEKGSCHSKEENTVEYTVRGEEVTFFNARKSANTQISIFVRRKSNYFRTSGSLKSAKNLGSANRKSTNYKSGNHKNIGSQIRNVPHLRNLRKYNKLFRSANVRICNLRNLFADCPSLTLERRLDREGSC